MQDNFLAHKVLTNLAKVARKRGFYDKPLRTRAMLEIRRRIITDHSYNDIMRDLHLSERTFYRYRDAVFAHDREQMRKLNDEEVLNQLAILRDRCNTFYQESRKIANDSSLEAHARVDALHLAGEYALLIFKTYTEAPPVVLAAQYELPPLLSPSSSSIAAALSPSTQQHDDDDEEEEQETEEEQPPISAAPAQIVYASAREDPRNYTPEELAQGWCYRDSKNSGIKYYVDLSALKKLEEQSKWYL
jgi:hypothetical protein